MTTREKHTPGPWTHETNLPVSVMIAPVFALGDNDRRRGEDGGWQDTAEANARLIAAAPDLLAALESCKAWMEQLRGIRGKWVAPGMSARYDEICAAILKACGVEA